MLMARVFGFHILLPLSGISRITWSQSFLIFFKAQGGAVAVGQHKGVLCSTLGRTYLGERAFLEIPACKSAAIVHSTVAKRWSKGSPQCWKMPCATSGVIPFVIH